MSAGIAYRAAVVEVNPSAYMGWDGSAKGALEIMLKNVATVDRWSAKAAAQAAQIIVFPEDMVSSYGGGGPNWRSKLTTPTGSTHLIQAVRSWRWTERHRTQHHLSICSHR